METRTGILEPSLPTQISSWEYWPEGALDDPRHGQSARDAESALEVRAIPRPVVSGPLATRHALGWRPVPDGQLRAAPVPGRAARPAPCGLRRARRHVRRRPVPDRRPSSRTVAAAGPLPGHAVIGHPEDGDPPSPGDRVHPADHVLQGFISRCGNASRRTCRHSIPTPGFHPVSAPRAPRSAARSAASSQTPSRSQAAWASPTATVAFRWSSRCRRRQRRRSPVVRRAARSAAPEAPYPRRVATCCASVACS